MVKTCAKDTTHVFGTVDLAARFGPRYLNQVAWAIEHVLGSCTYNRGYGGQVTGATVKGQCPIFIIYVLWAAGHVLWATENIASSAVHVAVVILPMTANV